VRARDFRWRGAEFAATQGRGLCRFAVRPRFQQRERSAAHLRWTPRKTGKARQKGANRVLGGGFRRNRRAGADNGEREAQGFARRPIVRKSVARPLGTKKSLERKNRRAKARRERRIEPGRLVI
jgi:hypothetical protein